MKAAFLILLAGCAGIPRGDSEQLLVGAAEVDVTPPAGWRRAGGFHEVLSTGVHDPLFVKALVFEQGGTRGALVVGDFCGVSREISAPMRRRAEERTGIPAANIVFSATHNHGGPEYTGVLWDVWRQRAVERHGRDIHASEDYAARVVESAAEAVARADAAKRPARLESGVAGAPGLAFNRRFHMKDGTVRFNPGPLNPAILRPAGPVDETLPVVLFRDASGGAPFASLCVFAMHTAVFGGSRFGADFPGVLQARLRETFGAGFLSVFAEGTAGDVNHIDVSRKDTAGHERIGAALAQAFLAGSRTPSEGRLAIQRAFADVPVAEATAEEEARARDVLALKTSPNPPFMTLVDAFRTLWIRRVRERDGAAAREEIQAFRLADDVAVVTLPHEVFVELGLAIRARSPFRVTLVVSLANDIDFYVPTRKAFAEGSYEVSTSPYLPGGGELLVEQATRLLESLRR